MRLPSLSFDDQKILKEKFAFLALNLSEYSFANLYLFQKIHQYELFCDPAGKELVIKGVTRDHQPFLMPTSPPNSWSKELLAFFKSQSACLYPIPFEWLADLEPFTDHFDFLEDDSDYLFSVEKIAHYSGRHLLKQRSIVKHLNEELQIVKKKFQKELQVHAIQVLDLWQSQVKMEKDDSDYYSVTEAIYNYEQLNLTGYLYYVDQIPKGLLIGEELNHRCFAFHFGKASREITGLNQWMFQSACQDLTKEYDYLNMEQDLGLANLRQTKHSYHPEKLLHKYRVFLKRF